MIASMTDPVRRTGAETRAEALRVALAHFTAKGYEATSMREIAEELGISKAALYYHFTSKADIVRQGSSARAEEVRELLAWARGQEAGPDLLESAVLRWIGSASVEKIHAIRFMNANPTLMRSLNDNAGIGNGLEQLVALFAADSPEPTRLLMIRMAFLSINAALMASDDTALTDAEIVATAREAALALLSRLRASSSITLR
jgi:AcrR family transcriptional regulator